MVGSSIYARDLHGKTAIQIAAWANDHLPMLETLYLTGSALEDKNKNGVTGLQCVVDLNHYRIVAYLLEIGTNLESRNDDDDSHFSMRSDTATLSRLKCYSDISRDSVTRIRPDRPPYILRRWKAISGFCNFSLLQACRVSMPEFGTRRAKLY